jgi:GNAT superfamily N-acetyltransferase
MTTTLRPTGPEEPLPGGGRTRRWAVCANGRPVGAVRASAHARWSGFTGEISELEITEGRRRGRGTVAVLAAEEVLRAWGCTRVDVTVPESAAGAQRLAAALGYRERMRNMSKRLPDEPPVLPEGLAERPIAEADFAEWLAAGDEMYVQELLGSGLSEAQARAKAAEDSARELPQGVRTPNTALRCLMAGPAGGEPVGSIWVRLGGTGAEPAGRESAGHAWVMSVDVAEASRGRGFGRALMLVAEQVCLTAGVRDLGLNVFTENRTAIGLYASLGYRVTVRVLGKQLL